LTSIAAQVYSITILNISLVLLGLDINRCSGILKLPQSIGGSLLGLDINRCSGILKLPQSIGGWLLGLDINRCSGILRFM